MGRRPPRPHREAPRCRRLLSRRGTGREAAEIARRQANFDQHASPIGCASGFAWQWHTQPGSTRNAVCTARRNPCLGNERADQSMRLLRCSKVKVSKTSRKGSACKDSLYKKTPKYECILSYGIGNQTGYLSSPGPLVKRC
jgi:hypothetical protein